MIHPGTEFEAEIDGQWFHVIVVREEVDFRRTRRTEYSIFDGEVSVPDLLGPIELTLDMRMWPIEGPSSKTAGKLAQPPLGIERGS